MTTGDQRHRTEGREAELGAERRPRPRAPPPSIALSGAAGLPSSSSLAPLAVRRRSLAASAGQQSVRPLPPTPTFNVDDQLALARARGAPRRPVRLCRRRWPASR